MFIHLYNIILNKFYCNLYTIKVVQIIIINNNIKGNNNALLSKINIYPTINNIKFCIFVFKKYK